jgi:hypothetical protein
MEFLVVMSVTDHRQNPLECIRKHNVSEIGCFVLHVKGRRRLLHWVPYKWVNWTMTNVQKPNVSDSRKYLRLLSCRYCSLSGIVKNTAFRGLLLCSSVPLLLSSDEKVLDKFFTGPVREGWDQSPVHSQINTILKGGLHSKEANFLCKERSLKPEIGSQGHTARKTNILLGEANHRSQEVIWKYEETVKLW